MTGPSAIGSEKRNADFNDIRAVLFEAAKESEGLINIG
jgi:hypothetical protein